MKTPLSVNPRNPQSYIFLSEHSKNYGELHCRIMDYFFKILQTNTVEVASEALLKKLAYTYTDELGEDFPEKIANQNLRIVLNEDGKTQHNAPDITQKIVHRFEDKLKNHIEEFKKNNNRYFGHIEFDKEKFERILNLPDFGDGFELFTEANYIRYNIEYKKYQDSGKKCWPKECHDIFGTIQDLVGDIDFDQFLNTSDTKQYNLALSEIESCVARFIIYSAMAMLPYFNESEDIDYFLNDLIDDKKENYEGLFDLVMVE